MLFAACFFVSPALASGFDAPGLVPALSEPDGSPIAIADLHVDRIAARNDPAYFVVRDWFSASVRLVVLCRPPVELRSGSTVDISGTMATLPDAQSRAPARRTASVSPPETEDGNWVYLTGRVVSHIGQYYSYAIPNGGSVYVYNIQDLDRTPGIRVWNVASYGPGSAGSIADVMAKLDTKDGQRMMGIWSSDQWDAIDLTSETHSIEPKVLAYGSWYAPPNVVPVGIINRDLGAAAMGNNPGVTGGQGLYNIGSYVTVWGEVLEVGTYQFDEYGWYSIPYMRIDDGSGVPSGNSDPSYGGPYGDRGVTVFGANWYEWYTPVEVGDYVSVTGVSSVWKPGGSTDTYRCIWTSNSAANQNNAPSAREVTDWGTISGTVKLYDMPEPTATVRLYSTCGRSETLTITREQDSSGSAELEWENVPKEFDYWEPARYIVSAQCDGYKTRTYTEVMPDTPRNLYVPRLRKIYVMTNNWSIDACPGGTNSTLITATIRDSDHEPIEGVTVRFRTNKGSFSESSILHDYTAPSPTNAQGQVTVTLYAVPCEWGEAIVEATDDSAPLPGDDPDDDPYKYDWQQLHDRYGQPIVITISQPTTSVELAPDPVVATVCENEKEITATVAVCGTAKSGEAVTFHTTNGTFLESGQATAEAETGIDGTATVTLLRPEACVAAEADVYAQSWPCGTWAWSNTVDVTWQSWKLEVITSRYWVVTNTPLNVKAKLTLDDGTTPVVGQSVRLITDHGSFDPHDEGYPQRYTANTDSNGEISTTLTVTECPVIVGVGGTTTTCDGGCTFTDSKNVNVVCEQPTTPCEIFFCIDCTGSMGYNYDHDANPSVEKFLRDMEDEGVLLRLGGIKFNDPYSSGSDPDTLDLDQLASLNAFDDVDGFISDWVNNGYSPVGGYAPELQLDALDLAAQDMNAYSTAGNPNTYIVLITDDVFHYLSDPYPGSGSSTLTKSEVITELTATGCKVYISLWEEYLPLEDTYDGLQVNGEFDPVDYGTTELEDMYPLARLRARIMANWP